MQSKCYFCQTVNDDISIGVVCQTVNYDVSIGVVRLKTQGERPFNQIYCMKIKDKKQRKYIYDIHIIVWPETTDHMGLDAR